MEKICVKLKNGKSVWGDKFDENDLVYLKNIFKVWMDLNERTKHLGGRNSNVPDILSEGLYCYFFNAVRTNGTAGSYDAVDINTGEGIQIKSASIKEDCTSFGPTSTWDRLYFVDFAPNGNVDGNVFFYEIISDNINKLVLNKKNNETFEDQQKQKRRPRFSVKKRFIEPMHIKPAFEINLID